MSKGSDIAAEVAQGIREAGAETGQGVPLTATLVRSGAGGGNPWDPDPGAIERHTITVVDSYRTVRNIDGTIARREHVLKMAVEPGGPVPQMNDQVELNGLTYEIADITPTAPGGVVLLWELRLDR